MTAAKSSFTELPTIDISDLTCADLTRRQAVADHAEKLNAHAELLVAG